MFYRRHHSHTALWHNNANTANACMEDPSVHNTRSGWHVHALLLPLKTALVMFSLLSFYCLLWTPPMPLDSLSPKTFPLTTPWPAISVVLYCSPYAQRCQFFWCCCCCFWDRAFLYSFGACREKKLNILKSKMSSKYCLIAMYLSWYILDVFYFSSLSSWQNIFLSNLALRWWEFYSTSGLSK